MCRRILRWSLVLYMFATCALIEQGSEARCRRFRRRADRCCTPQAAPAPACYAPSCCGGVAQKAGAPTSWGSTRVCAVYYGGKVGNLFLHYGMPWTPMGCMGPCQPLYLDQQIMGIPPCFNSDDACIDFTTYYSREAEAAAAAAPKHGCAKGYDPAAPVPPDHVTQNQVGDEILGSFMFGGRRIKLKLYRAQVDIPDVAEKPIVGLGFEPKPEDVGMFPDRPERLDRIKGHCCQIFVGGELYHVILTRGP